MYETTLLNERKYILDELKAEQFDLVFIDCEYTEAKVAEYIGAPFMQFVYY